MVYIDDSKVYSVISSNKEVDSSLLGFVHLWIGKQLLISPANTIEADQWFDTDVPKRFAFVADGASITFSLFLIRFADWVRMYSKNGVGGSNDDPVKIDRFHVNGRQIHLSELSTQHIVVVQSALNIIGELIVETSTANPLIEELWNTDKVRKTIVFTADSYPMRFVDLVIDLYDDLCERSGT